MARSTGGSVATSNGSGPRQMTRRSRSWARASSPAMRRMDRSAWAGRSQARYNTRWAGSTSKPRNVGGSTSARAKASCWATVVLPTPSGPTIMNGSPLGQRHWCPVPQRDSTVSGASRTESPGRPRWPLSSSSTSYDGAAALSLGDLSASAGRAPFASARVVRAFSPERTDSSSSAVTQGPFEAGPPQHSTRWRSSCGPRACRARNARPQLAKRQSRSRRRALPQSRASQARRRRG